MSEVDRVIARGIAQMVAACRGAVLQATLRPGMTELEAAQVWAQGSERLVPIATRRIALAFEAHLRHGIERLRISAAEIGAGKIAGARAVSVAFADIVGFTRLGEILPRRSSARLRGDSRRKQLAW
jgi:adenylate cyclase